MDDFLSGESGTVGRPGLAGLTDRVLDLALLPRLHALDAAASRQPPRRVLAVSVVRPDLPGFIDQVRSELAASRHHTELHTIGPGEHGKFANLNALLAEHPPAGHDWLLAVDDDVELSPGFLDRFLYLAEALGLVLAQPAHARRSHAAWRVTHRRPGALARRTRFVEIGPVTAFAAPSFATLLPFPELRFGWGLDAHWAAVAAEHGWPVGVVDATPVRHSLRPAATTYPRGAAVEEARAFLRDRPYLPARDASVTLETMSRIPA